MFDSNQFFGVSAAGGFYPKTIDQSARISKADSATIEMPYTSKDTATDLLKFTFSGWVKRGAVGDSLFHPIISAGTTATNDTIVFTNVDRLEYNLRTGGSIRSSHYTTAVFRDPSAWYHVVVAYDAANATAADRCKIYVNGVQQEIVVNNAIETDRVTRFTNNESTDDVYMGYGFRAGTAYYSEMYRAEFHMIDGQTLDPTYFAEEKSGIWVPKTYAGTYGNNGFHIDFSDVTLSGSNITSVNDSSPNELDFDTVSGVVASDIVLDSPTNNFATFNPLARSASTNLYEGNLRFNSPAASYRNVAATIPMMPNTGKWYWEVYVETASTSAGIVQGNPEMNRWTGGGYVLGYSSKEYAKFNQYKVTNNDFSSLWGTTAGTGAIIGFLFDSDNGDLFTFLNGSIEESGTAMFTGLTSSEGYVPALSAYNSTQRINFGQDSTFAGVKSVGGNSDANGIGDFQYTVPTDAKALCTSNLPDPAFDPAQDASPEDHMNVALYSGSGADGNAITGLGFQPDFVWIKERSPNARAHCLYDSVRGALGEKCLHSSLTSAEGANHDLTELASFDADGFTVDRSDNGAVDLTNQSGSSYVAWNWKAGGTASTIAVGDIDGTNPTIATNVSANTTSGFSIIGYTGNGTDGATIAHGLDSPPELCIFKTRDDAVSWIVGGYPYGPSVFSANNQLCSLDLNAAVAAAGSNAFTVGTSYITLDDQGGALGAGPDDMICYAFHSVDGFSKVGSYTGNGSTDGPFVYTGFRPKMIIWKRTNVSGQSWEILDTERDPYNGVTHYLYPDTSGAENNATAYPQDFLSNGFKIRHTGASANASGSNYIYIAFAESPFKYSNAR